MSLKHLNANEIAASMNSILGDSEFQAIHKKASFVKVAEEGDEDALLRAVKELGSDTGDFEDEIGLDTEEGPIGNEIDVEEDGELEVGDELGDEFGGEFGDELGDEFGDEELDFATLAALKVANTNLIKMANMFDKKGFAGIASVLDEAVVKLSAKKCKCVCKTPCKCSKCK